MAAPTDRRQGCTWDIAAGELMRCSPYESDAFRVTVLHRRSVMTTCCRFVLPNANKKSVALFLVVGN